MPAPKTLVTNAMTLVDAKSLRKGAADPSDWQWQLRNAITTLEGLEAHVNLTASERAGINHAAKQGLPLGITPYYLSLIDRDDPNCGVRRQIIPTHHETEETAGDLVDPLGEVEHEVAHSLVQRYPDRALLLVTDRCAIYCRFCTRSRMVGDGGGPVSDEGLEPAFKYLEAHPEIRDVIVSGGDPMAMATPRLARILQRLRTIESLDTVRLASRVPVALPMRITGELVQTLRASHPIWIMTHFNHPKELTPESRTACERLADAGFPVMNQSVLLRGVNDNAKTLEALFRGLIRSRVRPYYLLQADPVRGTGHLRTPLARGFEIMSELQGRVTGIALPKFICDTPGGKGKVPLYANAIQSQSGKTTVLRTFRGEDVPYIDP
jgi:lysine 2,3-aminomutase